MTLSKLADIPVFLILYLFLVRPQTSEEDRVVVGIYYAYLVFVLYQTLSPILFSLPELFTHPYVSMNWEPFIDIRMHYLGAWQEVFLNILLFIPFGFLAGFYHDHSFRKAAAFSFLLSLSIELLQPLISSYRTFDITDIITNVTGGILGYLLWMIWQRFRNSRL